MNMTFTDDQVFAVQSPVDAVEGAQLTFACTYWGAATSPSAVAYRNRQTITSTVFPTNSPTASGSVVTLSPAVLGSNGRYIIAITATVGGDIFVRKIEVRVGRDEDEQ